MEAFVEASFASLPNEMIVEVLERMRPTDVAKLCQSHLQMANFCKDERVFKRLLKTHFPAASIEGDLNYKQRYLMLVSQQVTHFRIPVTVNSDGCEILDLDAVERGIPDDWNQSLLTIQGDPLPGESAWIYSRLDSYEADNQTFAFPSQDECLRDAWNSYLTDDQFGDKLEFDEFVVRLRDDGDCVAAYKTLEHRVTYRLDYLVV